MMRACLKKEMVIVNERRRKIITQSDTEKKRI